MQKTYLLGRTALRMAVWRRGILVLLRIFCGSLCAVDACYRWLTLEHGVLPLMVGWLIPRLSLAHTHLFVIGGAVGETMIACCLLCGALTNLACVLGIALTLLGYATTGAMGMVPGVGPFDLGVLFVFILVFLGLALGHAGEAYGMDGWLSERLGRWALRGSKSVDVADAPRRRQRVLFM